MEYYYLVVYSFENGYGTARITRTKEIVGWEDLKEIERQLNKKNGFKSMIINYTLVGSKEVQEDKFETMDSKEYLEYLKERVDSWLEEVKKIVDDKSKYTDWSQREDIKAELKVDLILVLAAHGYPPVPRDEVFQQIFEQAENFKKYAV